MPGFSRIPGATAGLNASYAGVLGAEEQMPDWDLVQDLQERSLEKASVDAGAADQARREAVAVRVKRYAEGRDLALANRRDLTGLKNRFSSVYGDDVLVDVGLDKPLEQSPFAVILQKKHVRDQLNDPQLDLGEPRTGFEALDPLAIAAGMDASIEELDLAVESINDAAKHADDALIVKNEALRLLRLRVVNIARQMEAQYRLVGLGEAADRLRLGTRQRRRQNETDPDTPDAPPNEPDVPSNDPSDEPDGVPSGPVGPSPGDVPPPVSHPAPVGASSSENVDDDPPDHP